MAKSIYWVDGQKYTFIDVIGREHVRVRTDGFWVSQDTGDLVTDQFMYDMLHDEDFWLNHPCQRGVIE